MAADKKFDPSKPLTLGESVEVTECYHCGKQVTQDEKGRWRTVADGHATCSNWQDHRPHTFTRSTVWR